MPSWPTKMPLSAAKTVVLLQLSVGSIHYCRQRQAACPQKNTSEVTYIFDLYRPVAKGDVLLVLEDILQI